MRISTKGRYALRVIIDLAQHSKEGYISIKTISERQEVSMKYLEAIVASLHKAGLVQSQRGKEGGYMLTKPADEYTVGAIIRATEGSISPVSCLDPDEAACERAEACITLPMWQKLDDLVNNFLDNTTIADLINGKV
ncbi:MAG: RrF2 family transcriptional regulator [Oscillospiraceae bacterium]